MHYIANIYISYTCIAIQEPCGTPNISRDPNKLNPQETFKRDADQHMPITNVIRIMRQILPSHAKIADDAKETIQECVSELIHFITRVAKKMCRKERCETITPKNIISAIGSLGFDNYIEPITIYLNNIRNLEAERNFLQWYPFVNNSATFTQPEPAQTEPPPPPPPPPPPIGYAPSLVAYPVYPNNYPCGITKISSDPNNLNPQETFKRDADQYMPITNVIRIMRQIFPSHAKIAGNAKETIQECVPELISKEVERNSLQRFPFVTIA
ncbi:hypothetical protein RD792_017208 [Penstemon davidsonii]|uniref:Transcription factor CBF/NF-Y/archaeal histone domain-containing protein n=1 Tax=Penstemon davidsonii TaxID=160366 RepID=A0ABR0CN12_9LAMI|nr:hypothetical protein RD792_017208 [Penstemon davidsonii]